MENRITIKEYAELKKISIPTVYKRIDKGIIKVYKEGRNVFILIDDIEMGKAGTDTTQQQEDISIYIERVKHLEEALRKEVEARERAEADKKELYKQLEQSNILQLKSLETLKQLEHKTDEMQEELKQEKQKTWIDKLFRK